MPRAKSTTRRTTTSRKTTTRSRVSGTKQTPLQRVDKQITAAMKSVEEGRKGAKPRLRKLITKRSKLVCGK